MDGPLGLITAISCVAHLHKRNLRLPFAVEITGFADEEGVRFASTLLGSRAVAGTFDESVLGVKDEAGISMRDALVQFDDLWEELFPTEQARIVQLLVERIDVSVDGIRIRLRTEGIAR